MKTHKIMESAREHKNVYAKLLKLEDFPTSQSKGNIIY